MAIITIDNQPALAGQTAVITGGTRGIGLAVAKLFAENGAKVIIFGSREESVKKALSKLPGATGFWPNLSSYDEISDAFSKIVAEFGKIDILINNAGISAGRPIEDTDASDFEQIIDLNLSAIFRTIKAVVPIMKQTGGVIINTSSMVSIYGQPSGVGYPASKFGVNGLTKSLARELAKFKIRVNAVAPGVIDTDMMRNVPASQINQIVASIPLSRIGSPEDVANAFLYLASPLASYVTGEILSVDGAARS